MVAAAVNADLPPVVDTAPTQAELQSLQEALPMLDLTQFVDY
jgi:hypothetical protein